MSVARRSGLILVSQMLGLAGSFVLSIILARVLGPAQKGGLTFSQTVPSFVFVAVNVGIPAAVTYFVASSKMNRANAAGLVWFASIALTLLLTPLGLAVAYFVHSGPFAGLSNTVLLMMALTVPVLLWSQGATSLALALGTESSIAWSAAAQQVFYILGVAILILAQSISVESVFLVGLVTNVAGGAWIWFDLRRRRKLRVALPTASDWRGAIGYGFRAWIGSAMSFLHNRQDVLLVAYLLGDAALGVYSLAVSFAELIWRLPGAVSNVLMPEVARIESEAESADLAARVCRIMLTIALVTAAGSVLLTVVVTQVYLRRFASAVPALLAILPGVILFSVSPITSSYFSGRGKVEVASRIATITMFVNLFANLALIPLFGIVGAALSSTISYSVNALLGIWLFSRMASLPLRDVLILRGEDVSLVIKRLRDAVRFASDRLRVGRSA